MAILKVNDDGSIGIKKNKNKKKTADLIVGEDGKITFNADKVKSSLSQNNDIAPVRTDVKRTWFKSGLFEDGYDFGDITKTILGTNKDFADDFFSGVAGIGEGLVDTAAYAAGGVAGIGEGVVDTAADAAGRIAKKLGKDEFAKKTQKFIERDLKDEFAKKAQKFIERDLVEEYQLGDKIARQVNPGIKGISLLNDLVNESDSEKASVLGERTDSLVQSGGQLAGTFALQSVGVPWWLTTGVTSFGGGTEEAFQNDATYGEAGAYGLINAGAEILTEKIFGGIKFGGKALDEGLKKKLAGGIANKTLRTLTKFGWDMAGEGTEEVLSDVITNIGKKLTYEDETTLKELVLSEEAMDGYLESFIGGAVLGGGFNVGKLHNSIKTGRDYDTGLTDNEQSVIDAEVSERSTLEKQKKAAAQKEQLINQEIEKAVERATKRRGDVSEEQKKIIEDGVRKGIADIDYNTVELTKKEIAEIQKQVDEDLRRGAIDTFRIENTIYQEPILKMRELSRERVTANEARQAEIDAELKKLNDDYNALLDKNGLLKESYVQRELRKQAFEPKLTGKETEKELAIIENVKELELGNDRATHEMVDFFMKVARESDYDISLTNNNELEDMGEYKDKITARIRDLKLELKNESNEQKKSEIQKEIEKLRSRRGTIDGFIVEESGKLVLNVDSPKAMNVNIGHELTHAIEKSKHYDAYKKYILDYAKTKGVYDKYHNDTKRLYNSVKNADVEKETVSFLTGDYIFTDQEFVSSLSIEQPNIFKQAYDYIKHVYKIATAGSKEARQLERAKRMFDKAYKEMSKATTGEVDSNLTAEADSDTIYSLNKNFAEDVDNWYNNETEFKKTGGFFKVGKTSDALKSIGVKDNDIVWDKSKIKKILEDHEEMTIDVIKDVPNVLEYPVVVMQSKTRLNSITLLGEVYADGAPVMVAMQLSPKGKSGRVLNLSKISSAYAKNKVQELINSSDILYVDSDKKRTDSWLRALRLQLPAGLTNYGSIGNVTYYEDIVNSQNSGKTAFEEALEKAQAKKIQAAEATSEKSRLNQQPVVDDIISDSESKSNTRFSLSDNQGRKLSNEQQEYFKDSKVRDENGNLMVMYHGTPNGTFNEFRPSYFTPMKWYADRYQSQGASSLGYKKTANNPTTYEVYLNIKKPFDTREPEARRIFEEEYYQQWGTGTPLMESGLPDWMDGEDLIEFLEEKGYDYDGIILDEGGVGGYGEEVVSRGLSYVPLSPEQVKRVDNTNPTDSPDIRYSLSEADSKYNSAVKSGDIETAQRLVDEAAKNAGYTIKAYHGSRQVFNEFSRDKRGSNTHTKVSNDWFFASDKETANSYYPYGVMKELAKQSPNIWKDSDAERMKQKGKLYNLYIKMENPLVVDVADYDYAAHRETADAWHEYTVQAEENGNDGIILLNAMDNQLKTGARESTVYMFKDPNQAKSAEPITYDNSGNVIPLSERFNSRKRDIRFSLSSPVEENKNLMAIHNLHANEVLKQLDLGGMPMPSIAVTDPAKVDHEGFGDITLILDKDTIDPKKSKYNKVYSGDAYTPTFPRIEYEANEAVSNNIANRVNALYDNIPDYYQRDIRMFRGPDGINEALNSAGGENALIERYKDTYGMKQLYLAEKGSAVPVVVKETQVEMTDFQKESAQAAIKALGEDSIREIIPKTRGPHNIEMRKEWLAKYGDKLKKVYADLFIKDGFSAEETKTIIDSQNNGYWISEARRAAEYLETGGITVKKEDDFRATEAKIDSLVPEKDYQTWLKEFFAGVEGLSGLRNKKDLFTPKGNRRSFEALHDPITLDNIVKAMRGDEQQKGQGFLGGNLSGAAAQEYGSIEDIKKDSGRIGKLTEEEHKQNNKYIEDTLNEIAMRYADGKDWWDARNALVEAVAMRETKKGIKGYLKEYDYVYKLDDSIVDDLVNLRDYIRSLPVPYFEAKPQRAVGFDEVGVFVIPNNADAALKQKLLESGYSIAEYNPDIEGDRQRVVNEFEKYKFSLSNPSNDIAPVNRQGKAYVGGYAVYGSDMKRLKEEIAPIREDIQDLKNTLSDLRENVAALAPEPIIAANTPDIEDIAPVREDLKHKESKEENNDAKEPEADEAPLITKTRKELRKALLEDNKDVIMNALENAKNLSSPLMNNTDTIRLSEMVFGRKAGSKINEIIFQRAIDNEAKSVAWQNKERSDIKDLGIKPRSKESAAVQKWGEGEYVNEFGDVVEYTDSDLMLEFPNVADQKRIKDAAIAMRKKYDEYIEIANNVLTGLGFKPIEKRKNYFMHFQELGDFLSKNGIPFNPQSMKENNLPTDINGLTEFFVPQKKWFASMNQRKGKRTVYDAVTGIDKYISGVADIIYHTEDIQRGRAFEELIRDTYGQGEAANANRSLLPEELQMERLKKQQDAHLSKYARWLHNWTDNLAGKKNRIDRAIEDFGDRAGFSILDTARKQVSANMIGFNLSSSLTNLIASVQAMAKTNKVAVAKGTADTIRNIVQKDDFISKNSFLTNRFGSDMLSKNWWQKAQDAGFIFMKGMDWFSANQIVRSKFYELRSKGMSEEQAHAESGKFAARIMGDRTKGANAMFYNSKLFNVVGQFQLEVNNQLYSMFYDTYHESKEKAKGDSIKTAAGITFTLGQLFVMTHIFGQTFKAVAGYNPTFDVIGIIATALGLGDDDDDNVVDNLQEAADQLLDALPYSNLMTGGGRIPLSSAIPDIGGLITGGKDNYGNDLEFSKEMAKLPYLLMPAGYGQIKKTTQGLKMFDKDNPVPGSYTDNGNLRFPVEDTPFNRIQAGLFGQWSNENAREYFDNERQPLKEKQIQEYKDLDLPIADYWKYRDGLKEQKTLEDKFNYIADLDLPVSKKNIMINNIVDRKEKVDMINYDDFSSYEEFDFATKNPEKYSFLESMGVSYKDYKTSDEAKEAYDWAFNNPEKYSLAKAAAGDVVTYRSYASALNELKADKDSNGKTISGSRKAKVAEYINGLSADYGEKIILFKSEYPSDDTYNYEIIDYLNNREDITYSEMETILKELGFTVDAAGNVRW